LEKKDFSTLFDHYIIAAGCTTAELAKRVGLNRHTVTRWRKGDILRPDCEKIRLFAKALGLSEAQLNALRKAAKCPGSEHLPPITEPVALSIFVPGHPIVHPMQFCGRKEPLQRIFNKWKTCPLQNISITGRRGIGKSSVVRYLQYILPEMGYRAVLIDFKQARMRAREHLLNHILKSLQMITLTGCTLEQFEEILTQQTIHQPTLLLMDDMEYALASSELDMHFWLGLRSVQHNFFDGLLGILMTSCVTPGELAVTYGKSSPFFNVFGYHTELKPFSWEEAQELMARSPRPFPARDQAWIYQYSAGRIDILQQLCEARLIALQEGDTSNAWKHCIDQFVSSACLQ